MTIPLHHVVKFADDCTLLIPLFRAAMDNSAAEFQQILDWCMQNGMSVNFSKTKEVYCTFRSSSWRAPNVFNIEQVSCVKMLGYRFHENLKHDDHINKVVKVCQQYIFLLRKLKYMGVFQRELHILFVAWITSRTTYCSNIFARTSQQNVDAVERIYKRANKLGISYSSSFLVFAAHVMKRCSVQFLREIPIPSINCCSHYSKEPVVRVGQSTTGVSEFLSSEQLPIKTCFLTACNVMSCNHPNLKKDIYYYYLKGSFSLHSKKPSAPTSPSPVSRGLPPTQHTSCVLGITI